MMEGYTLGSGDSGESARMEVCLHGKPLGWACVECAHETNTYGTAPAHRADPRRFVLRAVCNHCGSRVWLPDRRRD
jgi:hypothetical protein